MLVYQRVLAITWAWVKIADNLESHSVQDYVLPQHMAIIGQKLWDHGHPQSTCSKHVQKYGHPHI